MKNKNTFKVPRWLKIQEQVDMLLWELKMMADEEAKRSGIDIMIDKATGHDKEQRKLFMKKLHRVTRLQNEYYQLTEIKKPEVKK